MKPTHGLGPSKRHLAEEAARSGGQSAPVKSIRPGLSEDANGRWSYDPVKGGTHPQQSTKISSVVRDEEC